MGDKEKSICFTVLKRQNHVLFKSVFCYFFHLDGEPVCQPEEPKRGLCFFRLPAILVEVDLKIAISCQA